MDDVAARPAGRLHDADFYAWTQEQAGLLRAGRLDEVDLENILEEIETLGRKEVSELRSRYRALARHLLKEIFQPEKSGRSWKTTILNQQIEIGRLFQDNPSLKAKAETVFTEAYSDARVPAASETGLALKTFPPFSPFTREQAVDSSYFQRLMSSDTSDRTGP